MNSKSFKRLEFLMLVTLMTASLCGCSKNQPAAAQTGIPEVSQTLPLTEAPETTSEKPEIDLSLIKTVNWKKVYSDISEDWYKNDVVLSNGVYYLQLMGPATKDSIGTNQLDIYYINDSSAENDNWADQFTLGVDISHLPEYCSYTGDLEAKYYCSDHKMVITYRDYKSRYDKIDYSGTYDLVNQVIGEYPQGSIIFTSCRFAVYQSIVMIPYVDGSADFIVNEKNTYHCKSFEEREDQYIGPVRSYIYQENDMNVTFDTSVGVTSEPTFIVISGTGELVETTGCYYADSTKYLN